MKLEKTLGQDLPKDGTPSTRLRKPTGNPAISQDFETFEEFEAKYPLDEITIPVCIVAPDDEGDYWLIQVAASMKNKVIDCRIWSATTQQISKYRTRAFRQYKMAMGVDFTTVKKDKADD